MARTARMTMSVDIRARRDTVPSLRGRTRRKRKYYLLLVRARDGNLAALLSAAALETRARG